MRKNIVSIIITTKNEDAVLEDLLKSIQMQTYKWIETIVVDNNSTDATKRIAAGYTSLIFNKGPERSAQRNFGARKASGSYLLFLDADMQLQKQVVQDCVTAMRKKGIGGIIIPEVSFGEGFWALVKTYERSFYRGDDMMEAARFYAADVFKKIGGFDARINGPEDWDLSERVRKKYSLVRVRSMIRHNEGTLTLWGLMKKKYYYARKSKHYFTKNNISVFSPKTIFFLRTTFYKDPHKILTHPFLFIAMMIMFTAELIAGGFGYLKNQ